MFTDNLYTGVQIALFIKGNKWKQIQMSINY